MRALYFIVYSGNYGAACHSLTDRSTMYVGQDHIVHVHSANIQYCIFSGAPVRHFSARMTYYIHHALRGFYDVCKYTCIIWETVQKIFFTIDDESLYDEP